MMYWILSVAVFAGAALGSQQKDYTRLSVQPVNSNVLQTYPSVVQIDFFLFWSTSQWSLQCSGSILTARYILSAAGCFSGWAYDPRYRRIRAGSSERNVGGVLLNVQDRILHPRWVVIPDYSGDVSVARLQTPLVYGSFIRQATIAAPASVIPSNLRISLIGWGRNENIKHLISQAFVTANRTGCGVSNSIQNSPNILCTLPLNASLPVNDDVGSALIYNGITIGIASGLNTVNRYPGIVAADISGYTDWIVESVTRGW